jgi:tRNA A-37 threonylcarbamoyl transferase component Bud32
MLELHNNDLSLSDVGPSNWIVTSDGVKAIDLSWGGSILAGIAQDTVRMKNDYQIDLPVDGFTAKLAMLYIRAKHCLRDSIHNFKKPYSKKNSSSWRTFNSK